MIIKKAILSELEGLWERFQTGGVRARPQPSDGLSHGWLVQDCRPGLEYLTET